MKLIANSQESLSEAIGKIRQEWKKHKYLKINIVAGKSRSLDQNALAFSWYKQISDERGEYTPRQVHAECKLVFGIPILRRDDEDFRREYDKYIKPKEKALKLFFVRDLPVSRIMTKKQFSEYLEEIYNYYTTLPTDRVDLRWPDDH